MDSRIKQHPLGFWEIVDKPTPDDLKKYYADKYYQEAKGSYELEYSEEEVQYFNAKLEQRLAVVKRSQPRLEGGGKMLDVGCGEGYALAFFQQRNWNVKGMDFSDAGVKSKNPDCLDSLVTGDLFSLINDQIESRESYDVVWLQNVLEHVIDPINLLKSLGQLVAKDGLAVVTVPNDCSVVQRSALDKGHIDHEFWIAPPDHLSYFDRRSLQNIANHTGWNCAEILGDFPIDWFLFNSASNYVADKTVGKAAHLSRVQIENLVHQQPIEDVIEFWSSMAKVGLGRDITAFLTPVGSG